MRSHAGFEWVQDGVQLHPGQTRAPLGGPHCIAGRILQSAGQHAGRNFYLWYSLPVPALRHQAGVMCMTRTSRCCEASAGVLPGRRGVRQADFVDRCRGGSVAGLPGRAPFPNFGPNTILFLLQDLRALAPHARPRPRDVPFSPMSPRQLSLLRGWPQPPAARLSHTQGKCGDGPSTGRRESVLGLDERSAGGLARQDDTIPQVQQHPWMGCVC